MEAILIPVKGGESAKLRLAEGLDPAGRRRLRLAMLADVLRATDGWALRLLATSDPDAEEVGRHCGCLLVPDPGAGLNAAIAAATARAVGYGVTDLLVLASDVPLVSSADPLAIFCTEADVVVALSDDGGTTALLRRPPAAIPPCFGPGSAEAHVAAARRAGLAVECLRLDSLALDVDDLADLVRLAGHPQARESVRVARELVGGALNRAWGAPGRALP
ncbi:MAG: 2-phospho-L-lactate guanylyltransferase [Actinomycetota bacterium]